MVTDMMMIGTKILSTQYSLLNGWQDCQPFNFLIPVIIMI